MQRIHDVAVIGGGPSGLHTAKLLAQKGLDVIVCERKAQIGSDIICTGVIGKNVFQEFGLKTDSVIGEVKDIQIVSSSGNRLIYRHPAAFACIVDREKFDNDLGHDARQAGAEIYLETQVSDMTIHPNHVELLTQREKRSHKRYAARMAVIATGIDYALNKKIGLGYAKNFFLGAQAELEIANGHTPTIFLDRNIAPGAFGWAVPTGHGRLKVGLLAERNPRGRFENLLKNYFPSELKNLDPGAIQVKAIAQGLVSKTYGDKVIVLGEAAGQVKTTTGGGIYFGLFCSQIAARILLKGLQAGTFHMQFLSEYEKLWKKAIQKEILIGYIARKVFSRLSEIQIERLFEIAKCDGIIPLIREKGNFDWQSQLILDLVKKTSFFGALKQARKKFHLTEKYFL
ncbi:MAG: NAD(P)/FAD-dependent oxidoreductase [Candidatus Aminicenantales bacterium]